MEQFLEGNRPHPINDQDVQASFLDVVVCQETQIQIDWRADLLGGIFAIQA